MFLLGSGTHPPTARGGGIGGPTTEGGGEGPRIPSRVLRVPTTPGPQLGWPPTLKKFLTPHSEGKGGRGGGGVILGRSVGRDGEKSHLHNAISHRLLTIRFNFFSPLCTTIFLAGSTQLWTTGTVGNTPWQNVCLIRTPRDVRLRKPRVAIWRSSVGLNGLYSTSCWQGTGSFAPGSQARLLTPPCAAQICESVNP